ncbi:PLP-dependent aminotransferase family protein [Thalassomonas sp. M1454]|uniref:aminotransferase-like domain-containing protein n=1 Tax=Thalassomonas sp. M1454 TaxID=2594477 RepID=UPI00117E5D8C|nr:PLP-dependent aminotransferase family protein [Thalassomonas sp. M1454]TRX52345.1 PLP-dependent aminotransferase family protein [Thalassomonas sp. M1454]
MSIHIYQDLVHFFSAKISDGILLPGDKLPSIRSLAKQHDVSKNTVIRALMELEKKALIEARPQVGYFVCITAKEAKVPKQLYPKLVPNEVSVPAIFYDIMARSAAFDILPKATQQQPSTHLVELNRHLSRALRDSVHNKSMYYDSPLGLASLRQQIKDRYRMRELTLNVDDFCITSGCQHSLFLALLVTCKPGDNVAVESPAFYGVLQLLEQLKLNVIEVSASSVTGLDPLELEKALSNWQIKACIVTPTFATPTGATMPDAAKKQLINLANSHDFAVIEDDIYGELSFAKVVTPIKALDTQQRVILCSSFSKSLSRDLRIGWIAAGRWHNDVVRLKLTSQLASCQTQQQGLASFISSGGYRRHLDYFTRTLEHQREQLLIALTKYWPRQIRYTVPQGGIALWLELDANLDTVKLYQETIKDNIVITPGVLFSSANFYQNYIRLSFNHATVGKREKAIKRLGQLIKNS